MYTLQKDQTGFSVIEAILVAIIVGAIGFIGWYVWHARQSSDSVLNTTTSSQAVGSSQPSAKASGSPGSRDNQALESDLNSINRSNTQSNQDLNSSTNSLNDQSTLTSIPQ